MAKEQYHHGDLKNALVQAGMQILAEDGIGALSLRKVAGRAGVSHAAPYAHFSDKQALIAAISTEGFRRLYERVSAAAQAHEDDPQRMLIEVGYAYVSFALDSPACFKLMFSGILEREQEYPDFVAMSKRNLQLVVDLARRCQQAGLLRAGPEDVLAVSLWSLVHGFLALLLDQQFSRSLIDRYPVRELLCRVLNQITLVEIVPSSS